jgi:hypothetical protein
MGSAVVLRYGAPTGRHLAGAMHMRRTNDLRVSIRAWYRALLLEARQCGIDEALHNAGALSALTPGVVAQVSAASPGATQDGERSSGARVVPTNLPGASTEAAVTDGSEMAPALMHTDCGEERGLRRCGICAGYLRCYVCQLNCTPRGPSNTKMGDEHEHKG